MVKETFFFSFRIRRGGFDLGSSLVCNFESREGGLEDLVYDFLHTR